MRLSARDDSSLEAQIARLGDLERRILGKVLHRQPVSRDVTAEYPERLSLGDRAADRIASFGGSWIFIGLFLGMMGIWMTYNVERPGSFDPYPFITATSRVPQDLA